jgi:hypothetical protein
MIKLILGVALIVLLIVAGPLAVLWSMNTLFPALAIPYSIETWFAALILGATISPTVRVKKS